VSPAIASWLRPEAPKSTPESELRDIGSRADRRLAEILLLGIRPGHALHVDLDAGVLLLEDIERLAHLRRLWIIEAESDRGIRNVGRDNPCESSYRKPTNVERRNHLILPKSRHPTGFAARSDAVFPIG
jgi:hypothetical protein